MNPKTLLSAVALSAAMLSASAAIAQEKPAAGEVVRHATPGSNFPIARAVEVPSGLTTVYVSGAVPPVADKNAAEGSIQAFGDTETQTVGVLKSIEATLKDLGLTMGDVVKMQVFLVGDPKLDGKMDFAGFMKGYTQFFGTTEQPNLPARSAMQVAGLVNPGWLVEIEVTAVRK
jgi:enamine deaminase RidA (YjgF/YER057c/UK114 family)